MKYAFAYEICLRHMIERILFHIEQREIFHNPQGLFHICPQANISLKQILIFFDVFRHVFFSISTSYETQAFSPPLLPFLQKAGLSSVAKHPNNYHHQQGYFSHKGHFSNHTRSHHNNFLRCVCANLSHSLLQSISNF